MTERSVRAGFLAAALASAFLAAPATQAQSHAQEQSMTDITALADAWLQCLPEGDFEAFPGTVSPDFVLRLPFVPEGVPTEFKGREVAQAALKGSAKGRSKLVFTNKRILRTEDPELVVTTADAEARMANGNLYRNSYVMFTRIRGREVLEHVEYLNPLAIMAAAKAPDTAD